MAQYIDKAAVVAESERLKSEYIKHTRNKFCAEWSCGVLDHILSFINTLEVKEVDLEKENFIKKEIGYIKYCREKAIKMLDELKERIAWLEKQNSNVANANKEYWRGYREGKQEIFDKYAALEKQGEQKPIERKDFISIPFGAFDSELVNETITIPDGCYVTIKGNKIHIKRKDL